MQALGHSKMVLEKELQEVISVTSQELEEYREKVLELEDEVTILCPFWKPTKAFGYFLSLLTDTLWPFQVLPF